MDYNTLIECVTQFGYPIVLSAVLLYIMEKNNERHREEMEKVTEALNNNTLAVTRLAMKLGDKDEVFKY